MLLPQLKPKDFFAIYLVAFIVLLKLNGINGSLDSTLALIVGYYFGHRATGKDNGV